MCVSSGLPRWHRGKEYTCRCRRCKRCGLEPWAGTSPWSRKWQPTPVFLPGNFHGKRSLASYSPSVFKNWTQLSLASYSPSVFKSWTQLSPWLLAVLLAYFIIFFCSAHVVGKILMQIWNVLSAWEWRYFSKIYFKITIPTMWLSPYYLLMLNKAWLLFLFFYPYYVHFQIKCTFSLILF